MAASERIVLGSGKLYCVEGTKTDGVYTIPADNVLEDDDNLLGYIQGGATIEYTPEFYTAKDDLGVVQKKFITNEEVKLTSGIMTWNTAVLKKLVSTGVATTETGKAKLKVGGVENFVNTQYVLRFVHHDAIDGDIRITIVGSNEAGFSVAFQKDQETVVNAEFLATPQDKNGTLLIIEFDDPVTTNANPGEH